MVLNLLTYVHHNRDIILLTGQCNSFSLTFPSHFAPVMFSWTHTFSFGRRLSESTVTFLLCFLLQ